MDTKKEQSFILNNLIRSAWFVFIIAAVHFIDWLIAFDFGTLGVLPRTISGIKGIFFMPLLHGDLGHLGSNSVPLFVLSFLMFTTYPKVAKQSFTIIYFLSGIAVWIFARQNYHIGASGVVYGLAFFLFAMGIMRKDFRSMALALLVVFLYGGIIWGLLPLQPGVSFEGHIFGALAGIFSAYLYKDVNKAPPRIRPEPEEGPVIEEPFWKPKEEELDIHIKYMYKKIEEEKGDE